MSTLLALLLSLHSGVFGWNKCLRKENTQNEEARKVVISFDDTDAHYSAMSDVLENSEEFRGRLAEIGEVTQQKIEGAYHESKTQGRDIVFQLPLHSSMDVEDAKGELRRVLAQTQDNFFESADSLRLMLRDSLGAGSEGAPQRMRGMLGRLETFAEVYHKNTQHPAMRSLLALHGVNTFFFVQSIVALINDQGADSSPFSKLMSFVGLIPQGIGVLDEAFRTVELMHWFIGKITATTRAIEREGGLVFATLRRIPSAMERFNLLRRTKFGQMLESGFREASTRLSTIAESSQKLAARAMDVINQKLQAFASWIRNFQADFTSFGRKLLRTHLADMAESMGATVRLLASKVSPTFTKLINAGTEAENLSRHLKSVSTLDLDIPMLRKILGNRVSKAARAFEWASVSLGRQTSASLKSFAAANRQLNALVTSVDRFSLFTTKAILAPGSAEVAVASPSMFMRKVSEPVTKMSSFMFRSLSKIGSKARGIKDVAIAARNSLSYARVFAWTKFKSLASGFASFMDKAAPFLVVADVIFSAYNLYEAIQQMDEAKHNPLMQEVATANLVIASVYMVNAAVSAVLFVVYTVAQALALASVVSIVGFAMGVLGVVAIVFMVVAYFIMQYYIQRAQCKAKLVQFHHYATTFARQVEQFMQPSGPLTTFTMLDTVYDKSKGENVTFPSYLYLERLTVDADTFLPEIRDFSRYLNNNGALFKSLYSTSAQTPRQGRLSTVILPANTYFRPGEHGCKDTAGCSRRQLRSSNTGAMLLTLQGSQREALSKFFSTDSSDGAMVLLPQNATHEQVLRWMSTGQRVIKHDSYCEEDGYVRYSKVTMPSPVTTKRQMELIVNVASLTILTPQLSFPPGSSNIAHVEYTIQINGNQEHQQLPHAANRLYNYSLTVPYIKLYEHSDYSSDVTYIINDNTPKNANIHWTIEFPHMDRAALLRWEGNGGVHEEIRAFCVPEATSVIEHEWKGYIENRKHEARRLKFQAPSGFLSERMGFLVKRGHYQFTVNRNQKMYQLLAVTLTDPAQVKIDLLFEPDEELFSFESIRRTKVIAAVLDVLQGYRRTENINTYTPGTLPIPIFFGKEENRPSFYFNPSNAGDRQWSFFCPRWKDNADDIVEAGFAFDCADNLLPNHKVHDVSVTFRGLYVVYDFPELNDSAMNGFESTITVLLPVEGVATVESARCPQCDRNDVQAALKRVMVQLKDTRSLVKSVYFSRSSLYIENVMLGITRYYSPEAYHRYEPFDAAKEVVLGYSRTGDCFMIRDRRVTGETEGIRLYRAVGVSDGTSDDTRLAITEPDIPNARRSANYGNIAGGRPTTNLSNNFTAAMTTKDASCPVQALNGRYDVFCVTCLDVTLAQARSVQPFENPEFNKMYVYAKRPVEFFTDTVLIESPGRPSRTLPGVLMFNNRVFELPPQPSDEQAQKDTPWYRFIGYWADFKCAAFKLADSERVSCYSAFPDDEVRDCQGHNRCVFTTSPLVAHFLLTTQQDAQVNAVVYPNQLHLKSELAHQLTFTCNINPTTHALTLEYVVSTEETCRHEHIFPVPDVLQRMGGGVALLVVNAACVSGRYLFGGCLFDVSTRSDAGSDAVVRVLSRDHPVWREFPAPAQNAVTFANMDNGRLFRLSPTVSGQVTTAPSVCEVNYLDAFVARPFATLASTPAEKVAATIGDRESSFMSTIELHMTANRTHVRVPYIRNFITQRVTVVVPDSTPRVQFQWTEFDALPPDQKVRIDIFIPRRVNLLLPPNRPQNLNVTVKFYYVDDQRRMEEEDHEDRDSESAVDEVAPLLSALDALGETTDRFITCEHCAPGEVCVANRVCFDPAQSFTRVYPRVFDPQFLPSDLSRIATFYCVVYRGQKYCHDRRRLYTILGKVLGRVKTVKPVNGAHRDQYIVLYKRGTVGTICMCRSTRCETTVMRDILQGPSDNARDLECNFVVRPLVVPEAPDDFASFPNVWRAFRLFPEPDANSERGRLGHARIELSLPRGGDFKYNRNEYKAAYNEFYSSAQCTNGWSGCPKHVLGGSAQRLAFAEIVDGLFVQVTSTGAVPAHEEVPFPGMYTPADNVLQPFLPALTQQEIGDRGIDIRMKDLFGVARSVLHFGLYALEHNFDLTTLNEYDFHCSVLLDRMGNFRYYDPNGGVSFYAYEKLEKKENGDAKVGMLPHIVGRILSPLSDALNSWNFVHQPGDEIHAPRDILNALDRLPSAIAAFTRMREDSTSRSTLEENILELEMVLSYFPRLQHCENPVNATATAERYAVNRFIDDYLVFLDTIKLEILDVMSIGETYRSDSPNERATQFLDTSCPALLVTMDLCKRPENSEVTTCTVVKLSLLYHHDVSSSSPRGTRVPRPPVETLVTTDEELEYDVCAEKTGCQKINRIRAGRLFFSCSGYCVKCSEGYQMVRGSCLSSRDPTMVGKFFTEESKTLTSSTLFDNGMWWVTFERRNFAQRISCPSPECDWDGCTFDAFHSPYEPTCRVAPRPQAYPAQAATIWPGMLTLRWTASEIKKVHKLNMHGYVGYYVLVDSSATNPVWEKIEPAGVHHRTSCSNHYLRLENQRWVFACNRSGALRSVSSVESKQTAGLMHLPYVSWTFLPDFTLSPRECSADSQCSTPCCQAVVVQALSKADYCLNAQAAGGGADVYHVYVRDNEANVPSYRSTDGKYTLTRNTWRGQWVWELKNVSSLVALWPLHDQELDGRVSTCVERQSDHARFLGLQVECLDAVSTSTVDGVPECPTARDTARDNNCRDGPPQLKLEDWGLPQPLCACHLFCAALGEKCKGYKVVAPWCYLWLTEDGESIQNDDIPHGQELVSVSPFERVPLTCNRVCKWLQKTDCIENNHCEWFASLTWSTDPHCVERRVSCSESGIGDVCPACEAHAGKTCAAADNNSGLCEAHKCVPVSCSDSGIGDACSACEGHPGKTCAASNNHSGMCKTDSIGEHKCVPVPCSDSSIGEACSACEGHPGKTCAVSNNNSGVCETDSIGEHKCVPGHSCSTTLNPAEEMREYSSVYGNQEPGTGHARSTLDSLQAWSAASNAANQYMTIDLGKIMQVYGTVVQGRHDYRSQWVSQYTVQYSTNGLGWASITGTFAGGRGDKKTAQYFQSPAQARYVKLIVKKWVGHISMRVGVIACPRFVYENVGAGKCVRLDGSEVELKYGDFNPTGGPNCENLCNNKQECGGYSVSIHGACLLYSAPQVQMRLDPAADWGESSCMLKFGDAATFIKANVECNSQDVFLGTTSSLEVCAQKCLNKPGCEYLIYGKKGKEGDCYWEKTRSGNCDEGWEDDQYDFYRVKRSLCPAVACIQNWKYKGRGQMACSNPDNNPNGPWCPTSLENEEYKVGSGAFLYCVPCGSARQLLFQDKVVLENQYRGLFLLQRNEVPTFTPKDKEDVKIAHNAAVWKILDKSKHGEGCVSYGEDILLENQFGSKWLLQRNEEPTFTTGNERIANNAAVWRILSKSNLKEGCVVTGDEILLQNQYSGKWLLQRNVEPTFITQDRKDARIANNAAVWKFLLPSSLGGAATLIRANVECRSEDESLGETSSLEDCAQKCLNKPGCEYLIYGKQDKDGNCYWEKTRSRNCEQGWENDEYDFYSVKEPFMCQCPNGTPDVGDLCSANHATECARCDANYHLTGTAGEQQCTVNVCECANGVADGAGECSVNGATECSKCDFGYHLDGIAGWQKCTVNVCECANGVQVGAGECSSDGATECYACNSGYRLDGVAGSQSCTACGTMFLPGSKQVDILLGSQNIDFSYNDRVYKLQVSAAYAVEVFENYHFEGRQRQFYEGTHDLEEEWRTIISSYKCQRLNVCECANGTPDDPRDCSSNGATECSACNSGYHLNGVNGSQNCAVNVCDCQNGTPNGAGECSSNDAIECSACNSGYRLSGDAGPRSCAVNVCDCVNGTPDGEGDCSSHGANECSACDSGYRLDGVDGLQNCAVNVCNCVNGTPDGEGDCSSHGANECSACDSGYRLDGVDGLQNCATTLGERCWKECGEKSGPCEFCGDGNKCCRKNREGGEHGCFAGEGGENHHECVEGPAMQGAVCWNACGKRSGLCAFCGDGNKCCRKNWDGEHNECFPGEGGEGRHECVEGSACGTMFLQGSKQVAILLGSQNVDQSYNDKAYKLQVYTAHVVEVFEHYNFEGNHREFEHGSHTLEEGWSKRISSYKCQRRPCSPEYGWDYYGNDLESGFTKSSWTKCATLCDQRSDCFFWTWSGPGQSKCYLKRSDSGRTHGCTECVSGRKCTPSAAR